MSNNRGSILIITLGFVLVFTLLGFASIYLGTVNSEMAEKRKFSEEAFWLAEGGVERAKLNPPAPSTPLGTIYFTLPATNFGNGTYNFTIETCPNPVDPQLPACNCGGSPCIRRWKTESTGNVGLVSNESRSIQAVFSDLVVNAVTTTGGISGSGNNTVDCEPGGTADINGSCEQIPGMTLFSYFKLAYTNDHAGNISIVNHNETPPVALTIAHSYDGTDYANPGQVFSGLTVITNDTNQFIDASKITGTTAANPAFLIIDCANPDKCYKSTGNETFNGIIWVIGNAQMSGTPNFNGSLFIQNGSLSGNLQGTNLIEYNEQIVATTLNSIGNVKLKDPIVVFWKEI